MLRVINILLAFSVIVVAVWMYELKYGVRDSATLVGHLERDIEQVKQDIVLLKAEWSHVARPDRIQDLAVRHLDLNVMSTSQIVAERALSSIIPLREPAEPVYPADDPIAGLLRIDR